MRQAREKASDSLWYKDAVVYELHIKSFHDSNDDGYGIADYLDIHPDYGTLSNFKRLLREAQMKIMKESPEGIIAHLTGRNEEGIVYEAIHDEFFRLALLDIVVRRRSLRAKSGRLIGRRGGRFSAMPADGALPQLSGVLKTEQSNTSIVYDRTFFLKLYRRLEEGVNPEAELLQNLTEHTDFANLPAHAGAIEWQTGQGTPITVASLLDRGADIEYLEPWANLWYTHTAGAFLHAYRQKVADADFVPSDKDDFALLLDTFLLEKAVYELGYELNNRPEWLMIPARGIVQILKGCTASDS